MSEAGRTSLRDALAGFERAGLGDLIDSDGRVALGQTLERSCLGGLAAAARGRRVLLATKGQLAAALALLELDGVAGAMLLCPPDLSVAHRAVVAKTAGADLVVCDSADGPLPGLEGLEHISCAPDGDTPHAPLPATTATDWILLTSGTSGPPKAVRHTLATLTGAIGPANAGPGAGVWSTFYDIRRYGGLQIFLRAVLGGHALVLSNEQEPLVDFLARAGASGAKLITGTPSHWRNALMSGALGSVDPAYVRLSGEIAGQVVLNGLKAAFPKAQIVHAFASTEAGVAFEVSDGLEGFPAAYVGNDSAIVSMRVVEGSLRIRSGRAAFNYVGDNDEPLLDKDGYVDTGDMVVLKGERYYFTGRRGGIINVGGAKVHPEEVEAVIDSHPGVALSLVKARANPIMGAIVVAEIVLKAPATPEELDLLREEITALCQKELAAHKVPLSLRFVASLPVSPSGKLVRPHA
jgi:acyl-CoA synthetase (AMP-forming)/AMP-acid ligase II